MARRPHVVVVPYPAQGHVNPSMHLSQIIAEHGIKVTFVNSEFNHKRVLSAMSNETLKGHSSNVNLVSIPDGLEATDDRNEIGKLCDSTMATMPQKLEELISELNKDDPVTVVVFDVTTMGWAGKVAAKMGIKSAGFFPASAAIFAIFSSIPRLIHDGIIDHDGYAKKKQMFQLSPGIPPVETQNLIWTNIGDPISQKSIFKMIESSMEDSEDTEWILCNSIQELEPGAFSMFPKLLQIGPLLADYHTSTSGSQFWREDSTCLNWLDQRPPKSVIYIAFGSFTILDPTQFQELAEGLELTNKTFLWVVRPGSTHELNYEIKTSRGKIVGWVPQQKVLSHPSIACFVSHCGWNSTIEGVSHGVPFLCWPYFADQFLNKNYICDLWKVGLGFDVNENGIITKEEFKGKVERLLGDGNILTNCLKLKRMISESIGEGGRSSKNLDSFINWLKA